MGRRPRDQAARGRRRSDDVPTQASTKTAAHKRYLEHHRGPGTKEPAAYVNNLSGRRPGIISPRSSTWRPRDQGARGHRRGGHGTKEPGHRRGESASSPDAGTSDIFKPPTLPDWGTGHGGIRDDVPTQASAEPRRISEARSESPTARSLRNVIGGHVRSYRSEKTPRYQKTNTSPSNDAGPCMTRLRVYCGCRTLRSLMSRSYDHRPVKPPWL